jgi:hypothetical protein
MSAELGVLNILPAGEGVLGRANATAIIAACCHPNETGGRFTNADRVPSMLLRQLKRDQGNSVSQNLRDRRKRHF